MTLPSDETIRYRASRELDKSFVLDAGAGTGKTTVLVSRILEAVRRGRSDLEHIIAITFTEKAAGELKVRLRFELERALRQSDGDETKRLRQAIADMERAQVTTIHSFCTALLHERPIEAGVAPDFEVLDELGAALLKDKIWAQWLGGEMNHGAAVLAETLRSGVDLSALRPPAEFLLDHRHLWELAPAPVTVSSEDLLRQIRSGLGRLGALHANCREPKDRAYQEVESLRRQFEQLSAPGATENLSHLMAGFAIRPSAGNQQNWTVKEALEQTREILRELKAEIEKFRAMVAHNRTLEVARWLHGFVDRYEAAKRDGGCLDFFDLLYRCRNLLKDNKQVRGYFQGRFDFILVDEFQDTDPLQIEILSFLSEQSPRANHWSEVRLRAGKLFLVGDPQQSIYSFRGADIEAYHEAKAVFAGQGEALPLSFNFRSRPPLIDWINGLFSKLICPPADGHYQPSYQPIAGARDSEKGPAVLTLPLAPHIPIADFKAADLRLAEARTVATFLKQIVTRGWPVWDPRSGEQRPIRYGDVAILFRTKEAIDRYEEEFRDFDIPYRVAGGRRYYSRLEMNSLLALLSCLDNPKDSVALVAALRSPFFGVSDEELFLYVQEGYPLDYTRAGLDLSGGANRGPSGQKSIYHAFQLLKEFHLQRNLLGTPLFLLKLYQTTRILPLLYLKPQGDQKVANLLKMVDMARSLDARGLITLRAFVRFLKKMDSTEAEEGESPLAEESEDVARLMTIHKAKGLEFPLVILGDVAYGGSSRIRNVLLDRERGKLEIRIGAQDRGIATLGWEKAAENQRHRELAERLRLLYVAVTRARDYFVLPLGTADSKEKFLTPLWQDFAFGENILWGKEFRSRSGGAITVFDSRALDAEKTELRPFRPFVDIQKLQKQSKAKRAEIEASLRAFSEWEEKRRASRQKGLPRRLITPAGAVVKLRAEKSVVYGSGPLFGSLVHELLRTIDFHNPTEIAAIARTLGQRYGLSKTAIQRAVNLVEWALSCPTLSRATRSRSLWKEVPFVYRYHDHLVEGFIDLVFEEDEGLVVVDFKTDAVRDADELEEKLSRYVPQGTVYALALEAVTKRRVKEVVFLFLSAMTEKSIALDKEVVQSTQRILEESLHLTS